MNQWVEKTFLFYLALYSMSSCTKDVHIHVPPQKQKLVVNCLFNPDSVWKVFVGTTMPIGDTLSTSIVKNAKVAIEGGNQIIHLNYLNKGYYVSRLKPKVGTSYTIKVSAAGFPSAEASDRIPAKLSITSFDFDTLPIIITPPDELISFDKEKVNKLTLSLDGWNKNSYAQIKGMVYNKNELFDYIITNGTLEKTWDGLKSNPNINNPSRPYPSLKVIDSIISKLQVLKDEPILSQTKLRKKVTSITGAGYTFIYDTLIHYTKRTPASNHIESLFKLNEIYATQPPFYNLKDDAGSAFAKGMNGLKQGHILLYSSYWYFSPDTWWNDPIKGGDKTALEVWMDLFSLSRAAFQFKTTYIKNQAGADDPFSEPVQVYNNIRGGYGIFAGYQKQRVRIY